MAVSRIPNKAASSNFDNNVVHNRYCKSKVTITPKRTDTKTIIIRQQVIDFSKS
jgi:hypothetical protein